MFNHLYELEPNEYWLSVSGKLFWLFLITFASISAFEYTSKFVLAVAAEATDAKLSDFLKKSDAATPPSLPASTLAETSWKVKSFEFGVTLIPLAAFAIIDFNCKLSPDLLVNKPDPIPKFSAVVSFDAVIVMLLASAVNVTFVPAKSDLNCRSSPTFCANTPWPVPKFDAVLSDIILYTLYNIVLIICIYYQSGINGSKELTQLSLLTH